MKDNKTDIFKLIRDWWNFAFENPDLVKPNHSALYFFIIEHGNRLGWKDKFGLPSTMTMEAIGIKSYNTYINTFNDLVEWKFIILVEKSRNQYSSNIIAISNFDKANDKALDRANIKRSIKKSESTVQSTVQSKRSILKQDNKETNLPKNNISSESDKKNWKNDFDIYVEELRNAYKEIQNDTDWIKQQESFYLNVDIIKSIEKACVNYWATPTGWKKKKQSKISDINWKSTFGNAISLNKVYKNGNSNLQPGSNFGNSENKQNTRRTTPEDKREKLRGLGDMAEAILQNS